MAQRDNDPNQIREGSGRRVAGRDALPLDRSALDVPPVTQQPYITGGQRLYYEGQPSHTPEYLEEKVTQEPQIGERRSITNERVDKQQTTKSRNDDSSVLLGRPDRDYGQLARYDQTLTNRVSDKSQGHSQLRVKDIMTRNLTTVSRNTSLNQAAMLMKTEDVGSLPVMENNLIVGIITDRDIVVRAVAETNGMMTQTVGDVMTSELTFCRPDDQVVDVLRQMGDQRVRRLPIIDGNGVLKGIVSLADLALEIEKDDRLAQTLTDISKPGTWH